MSSHLVELGRHVLLTLRDKTAHHTTADAWMWVHCFCGLRPNLQELFVHLHGIIEVGETYHVERKRVQLFLLLLLNKRHLVGLDVAQNRFFILLVIGNIQLLLVIVY